MKRSREEVARYYTELYSDYGILVKVIPRSGVYTVVDELQLQSFGGRVAGVARDVRQLEAVLKQLVALRPTQQAGTAR